mgnify:CR=1 FL=1
MNKLKYIIVFFLVIFYRPAFSDERTLPEIKPEQTTIDMSRMFAKDIFELNGVPYLQPTVEAMNTTSNARFYNNAFVVSELELRCLSGLYLQLIWEKILGNLPFGELD